MYFGIPPEVNAFRLARIGAGPEAHAPQVAAYTSVAAVHEEQAVQQMVTAAATAPGFVGVGGIGMLAGATPMAAWQGTAGGHAAAAAQTIGAGMAAYGAAVAATIPFEEVVENRIRLAVLHATNFMGINGPAIAATEGKNSRCTGSTVVTRAAQGRAMALSGRISP